MRTAVRALLGAVVLAALVLLFVFPVRTLIDQGRQISATEHQLLVLDHENAVLSRRASALEQPSTVERIAREQYGMVMPGQRSYAVAASPATPSG
jgi:cell division protein FtsB